MSSEWSIRKDEGNYMKRSRGEGGEGGNSGVQCKHITSCVISYVQWVDKSEYVQETG